MKKLMFSLLLLSVLGCHSDSKKSLNATVKDSQKVTNSVKKVNSIIGKEKAAIVKEQSLPDDTSSNILGIWIVSTSKTGNASFVLEKNTIYYPETDSKYKYKILGDSIEVKYDDYTQHLFFKLRGKDTLILKGDDEDNIYYRVRK